MTPAEQICQLNSRLAHLYCDVSQINKETDDLATRLWIDKTVARLDDAVRTLHNAQIAAERAEGLQ